MTQQAIDPGAKPSDTVVKVRFRLCAEKTDPRCDLDLSTKLEQRATRNSEEVPKLFLR